MRTLAQLISDLSEFINPAVQSLPAALLQQPVSKLTADSRAVVPGALFVAVRGSKADGHSYLAQAQAQGCLAAVVEEACSLPLPEDLPLIRVSDGAAALAQLAAAWYGHPAKGLCLIGITGTNGKTTCTWLLEAMLHAAGCYPGVLGTINYRAWGPAGPRVLQEAPLTTPDPLTLQAMLRAMVDAGVSHVVMEVSSHALHQGRLGHCRFDLALFTNLSQDHLDFHPNLEQYFATKQLLFTRYLKLGGKAVIAEAPAGAERDWGAELLPLLQGRTVLRTGLGTEAAVRAEQLVLEIAGFHCTLQLGAERHVFASKLVGDYNVSNVLLAAGAGLALGLPSQAVCAGLSAVTVIPGRLETVRLEIEAGAGSDFLPRVFVDYAHTPDALDNVLRVLRPLTSKRLFCVFGCGGDRDRSKRPLMGAIAARRADVVLITSDNPRSEEPQAIIDEIVVGLEASRLQRSSEDCLQPGRHPVGVYTVIPERGAALHTACRLAEAGDTVLVAGKGHENYQLIGQRKFFFDDRLELQRALMRWSKPHLLAATGGRLIQEGEPCAMARIITDSRTLEAGDVFVALRGEQFDGHTYSREAVEKGAVALVLSEPAPDLSRRVDVIQVNDTLEALGHIAGYRRRLLGTGLQVCAITGSSGKTTVKEMLARIFNQALGQEIPTSLDYVIPEAVLKTEGNFNNLVGLPLTLLQLDASHKRAVLELGMSAPGEIARLTTIADPDIGCINNVHPAHLLGLGSLEGIATAKGELFAGMRPEALRVANFDDPLVRELGLRYGAQCLGFALNEEGLRHKPLVWINEVVNQGEAGVAGTLHIDSWQGPVRLALPGMHNLHNCAAAAAMAFAAGIDPEDIIIGLESCATVGKRLVLSVLPSGLKLVNDVYNANPASMAAGLHTVAAFHPEKRHAAALGDMLELGAEAESLHRKIGSMIAVLGYSYLALFGEHAWSVAQGALNEGMRPEAVQIFSDITSMADWFRQLQHEGQLSAGDWLLVKGSRGMRMERLIEELAGHTVEC